MPENEQVNRLEPSRSDRFGDVREAGRRGGMQKEANWQARVAENRDALMALAPEAIETVGAVMRGEKRPNVLPAAVVVLDRTDLGPTTKTQVTVGPSDRLVQLIKHLDGDDSKPGVIDVRPHPEQSAGQALPRHEESGHDGESG